MLKIQEVRELIKLINESDIEEFKFEQDGTKIKMKKSRTASDSSITEVKTPAEKEQVKSVAEGSVIAEHAPQKEKQEAASVEELHKISSPMVGTFYESSSPEQAPFVKIGGKISSDTVVCIVEAMKLFNEIEAEITGEIVEILVKNGQLVEYGQPLFLVKAE